MLKIDYANNHAFKSLFVSDSITLHTACELERTLLVTILAMSVKNLYLSAFFPTQNRNKFFYVRGSTAWLIDWSHHISPLYAEECCYDESPNNCLNSVMYVHPITRQTFEDATPITF